MEDEESRNISSSYPPSYEQVERNQQDAPPSYDSIYGKVKAAKSESSGNFDFLKKFAAILLGTIGCTIMIGIILVIPVSMVVMGALYLHSCEREHYIPIYLIVGGVFGIIKNFSNLGQNVKNKRENNQEQNTRTNPFDAILNCFLFAWFIAGSVWIYRIYNDYDTTDPNSPRYCNHSFYLYAFWLTTATYILAALSCCCFCTVFCVCGFCNALLNNSGSSES